MDIEPVWISYSRFIGSTCELARLERRLNCTVPRGGVRTIECQMW